MDHETGRRPRRRRRAALAATAVAGAGLLGVAGCVNPPGDAGPADVALAVDMAGDFGMISPLIYGTNGTRGIAANRQTLVRLGGNRWTAYNWENNASNAGSDYQFQNDGFLSPSTSPAAAVTGGRGVDEERGVDGATAGGAAALVTVPIVDHVAADRNGGGDVRNSGTGYLATRFVRNHASKPGAPEGTPDTADGNVYQDEFVNWLKVNRPQANVLFSLDNEPDLWANTHAEVHADKVTYQELIKRNVDYATAIKKVSPSATVTGPVNYGYAGFTTLQGAADADGRNFVDAYLDAMRGADAAAGHRLVDALDVHWYPEARGGGSRITDNTSAAGVVEARLQAPRSLWDPTYVEDSWIANDVLGRKPIALLPDLRARIAARNPGMGLAVTEWNYGGGNDISGALATADVLGIFGREGVTLANLWELNAPEAFTYAAFRAFRNYDGQGSTFGDVSRPATTTDEAKVSVYASSFSSGPDHPVIVAVNKDAVAHTAAVTVRTAATYDRAAVYQLTAAAPDVKAAGTIALVATNAFRPTLPARSVTIIAPAP
jgi:hypothetical protein